MVTNDLASYYKEAHFNETANFLISTDYDIDKEINDLEHDLQTLLTFDKEIAEIGIDQTYVHLRYVTRTDRYENKINDSNTVLYSAPTE